MRPDWRILIDGQARTGTFRNRLLSLTLTDESGYHSDTVSVSLDDRGCRIVLPRTGVEMVVQLGYKGTGRVQMGRYTVDEVEVEGPPDTVVVRGKSVEMFATLKQHKSRSWSGTLRDIVGAIASEHGLEPRVGSRLASMQIPHIDQTEESDLHFLTRLGQQYDAVAKPAGRYLLLVARDEAITASGQPTTSRTLHRGQTSRHRITSPNRSPYRSVIAYFHEPKSGTRSSVRAVSGTPSYTLRNPYPTANEARAAAPARLRELARGLAMLTLTVQPGDPLIAAESRLRLRGFRSGIDGSWVVTTVTQELDNTGLRTLVGSGTAHPSRGKKTSKSDLVQEYNPNLTSSPPTHNLPKVNTGDEGCFHVLFGVTMKDHRPANKTLPTVAQHNPEIVDMAYRAALKSYEVILQRVDAADTRTQKLLTISCTFTFAIPVVVEHMESKHTMPTGWAFVIGLLFAVTILIGVWNWWRRDTVIILSPTKLLALKITDPLIFKREVIRQSGRHLQQNKERVRRQTRRASLMCFFLVLEILAFASWALSPP